MNYIDHIQPIHLDILKEVGNIGAGHAATSLSTLLNRKIDMKVPSVRIVPFTDMMELTGGSEKEVVSVSLRIEGEAGGNMFFMLTVEEADRFIQKLMADEAFSFHDEHSQAIGFSAMQEMGNILSGSYLSALGDFTQLKLQPSVPELAVDMFGAIISYGLLEISQYSDYAIVIDTVLTELNEGNEEIVKGHFFLLLSPDSFPVLFEALGAGYNE
ncbi:chemotaxis protein CheC [Domibacillus enclensis]|uniref:CheY-P-specific phosphatase CheC n=1 Tax=Domibacillus enclensis TaxID=1017273 RepID=A0A1N6UNC6_9BACI|nr:chemotaxis protein CheC [Domibacillus enclensis]OXS78571.1 CheY-P-specific phosphatase CheC [Domibacillus enclensis]SIQ66971.1 chemotaxis protein CheC [Domibacillus enclensis]